MIIGIDASRANLPDKTGTEWYAYNLIQEFKKIADPQDQFILYSKEALTGELAELPHNFQSKILHWPILWFWTQLRLAWEMLWHSPDVLFVPAHTIPIISPKNTVITLHDIGFERFQALYSQKEIGPPGKILKKILKILVKIFTLGKYSNNELDYHRWSTRLALKKAKLVITISQFSRQEIMDHFQVNDRKLKEIYHGFNTIFQEIHNPALIQDTLDKYQIDRPFLLYIGRLEEKKNTAGLITAYAIFKKIIKNDYYLVLTGKPGLGFEKIKETIIQHRLTADIKMLDWVDEKNLAHLMKAATAFVFPGFYEGFGMPILEAMACGTPVITSDFGATKEISGSAALLVDPYQPDNIAQAMIKVITDNSLRQSLISQGFKQAAKFSWSNTAYETLQTIKTV